MVKYYKNGKAYLEENQEIILSDGTAHTQYTYTEQSNITVIGGVEYPKLPNAPEPFVYGAKIIVMVYSEISRYQKYYDVRTGEFKTDSNFKGKEWIENETPNFIDTLTPREAEVFDQAILEDRQWSVIELPKGE